MKHNAETLQWRLQDSNQRIDDLKYELEGAEEERDQWKSRCQDLQAELARKEIVNSVRSGFKAEALLQRILARTVSCEGLLAAAANRVTLDSFASKGDLSRIRAALGSAMNELHRIEEMERECFYPLDSSGNDS